MYVLFIFNYIAMAVNESVGTCPGQPQTRLMTVIGIVYCIWRLYGSMANFSTAM